MSDSKVRAALEQMEAWLVDPAWEPDAEALAQWNVEFQVALAQADKAPGWPALMDRAHAAGQHLEVRSAILAQEQDKVRAELEVQERGNRALKGYGASAR